MSIKYNGKLIAGKYKTQVVTDATEGNKGLIRIATLEEVNAGTDNTTAVTPKGLATKQDKLTAGTGIEITGDNVINNTQTSAEWGNIQGDIINQSDLIDEFDKKQDVIPDLENIREGANKGSTSIQAGDNISTLINDAGYLTNSNLPVGSDTQKGIVQVDNITIESNDGALTSIATKTKSNTIKIDWEGTNEEYEAGIADGSISPDWYCYITDDETIVDFNDFANNSLSNLSEAGQAIVDNKASIDLDNLSEVGEKHFLNKSQITNCLTEAPQRIKYTLENGTLTIKAGSVVIVPYGTEDLSSTYTVGSTFINENFKVYDTQFSDGKFFVWVESQNDISIKPTSEWATGWHSCTLNITQNTFFIRNLTASGSSTPSTDYTIWYDTANNICKDTQLPDFTLSLPLLTCTVGSLAFTSVNQVFNGMGYIGSTVWVDKGVKGLIPNGRNADGTLRNIEFETEQLSMINISVFGDLNTPFLAIDEYGAIGRSFYLGDYNTPPTAKQYATYYNIPENKWYVSITGTTWVEDKICFAGHLKLNRANDISTVSSFTPKQTFRAIDYSDKSEISGWSMPSNKCIDLGLGASGTSYTAPANGWFSFRGTISSNANTYWDSWFINSGLTRSAFTYITSFSGDTCSMLVPAKTGDTLYISYTMTFNRIDHFRFYYAQGEVA